MQNDPFPIVFLIFWIIVAVLILVYGPKWINTTGTQVKVLDWLFPNKHVGQRALPTLNRIRRFSILSMRILWGLIILLAIVVLIWSLVASRR